MAGARTGSREDITNFGRIPRNGRTSQSETGALSSRGPGIALQPMQPV